MLVDIVDYPLSYFYGAIVLATLNLYLRSADICIKACSYCLTDLGALFLKTEMLQKHSSRKYLSYRIGYILACGLWP